MTAQVAFFTPKWPILPQNDRFIHTITDCFRKMTVLVPEFVPASFPARSFFLPGTSNIFSFGGLLRFPSPKFIEIGTSEHSTNMNSTSGFRNRHKNDALVSSWGGNWKMVTPKYRGAFEVGKSIFETKKFRFEKKVSPSPWWAGFIGAKSVVKTFFRSKPHTYGTIGSRVWSGSPPMCSNVRRQ